MSGMSHTEEFVLNGYPAVLVIPDCPNGKWIWKTEFFYAFDAAERALLEKGYTRAYYQINDQYGSPDAVSLMRAFQEHVVRQYRLADRAILFGFSRGGLYAFNYALRFPECVEKIYLDAPVLDLRDWPPSGSPEQEQMFKAYRINRASFEHFSDSPVDRLDAFFQNEIPLLLIAGCRDETVSFSRNAGRLLSYCERRNIPVRYYLKPEGGHHPHSLDDVSPVVRFVTEP